MTIIERQFAEIVNEFKRTCPIDEQQLLLDMSTSEGMPLEMAYRLQVCALLSLYAHRPNMRDPLLTWSMRGMWHRMVGEVYLSRPAHVMDRLQEVATQDGQAMDSVVAEMLLCVLEGSAIYLR